MRVAALSTAAVLWITTSACEDTGHGISLDGGDDAGGFIDEGPDDASTDAPWDASAPPVSAGCDKLDVLFVIDNSVSMTDEQENLAHNFGRFVKALRSFREGKVDFRIGVTTTRVPSSGLLGLGRSGAAAGTLLKTNAMQDPWLESTAPDLEAQFELLATVGTDGSWTEQPLQAAREALTSRIDDGVNADFLRPDALLSIVIITDEDDLSADESRPIPVSEFVTSFDAVKGARYAWSAAVIAGDEAPACSSRFGNALYAARLLDFVSASQGAAVFSSICRDDLSQSLDEALSQFAAACDAYVL